STRANPDTHFFPTRRSSGLRHEGEVDGGNRGADGHAAQQGRGLLVPAVALGTRDHAPAPCQGTHHRGEHDRTGEREGDRQEIDGDRKSTRLNSSHVATLYAV